MRGVVVPVDEQHVAAGINQVLHVDHHLVPALEHSLDVVDGGFDTAVGGDPVTGRPASGQRDMTKVEFEPIGLLDGAAAGVRSEFTSGLWDARGELFERRLVHVGHVA